MSNPTVNIMSPNDGDEFFVGEVLRLKGEAFYNNGTSFKDSLLEWEVIKHHNDHNHSFLDPTFGNNFDLSATPKPEDIYASLNSYLEIFLRVTDESGLVTEKSRIIRPALVRIDLKSNFPGVIIVVEDEPITLPHEIWGWKEQQIQIKAEDNPPILFKSWSDGVRERDRTEILNSTIPAFEAIFCVDDGGKCLFGSKTCCIGSCDANGICAVQVKLPPLYVDTTFSPTNLPTNPPIVANNTATHESIPVLPSIFDNIELGENVIQNDSWNVSCAGKVMLCTTFFLVAGIVASFFFMWQCKELPRSNKVSQIHEIDNENQNKRHDQSPEEFKEEIIEDSSTSSSCSDDAIATT